MKKPKEKKSAFDFFAPEEASKIKKQNPNISKDRITKKVKEKWESLNGKEKQKYYDMASMMARFEQMKKISGIDSYENSRRYGIVAVNSAKDPNNPKPPKSAYLLFRNNIIAQIRSENGNISFCEATKEIGKKWREVDADTRSKYEKLAAADKERYNNEMKDNMPSIKPMKKQKDPNKPKRNLCAFMFFSIEKGATMRKAYCRMSGTEISKALGSLWKDIDAEKRKKYDDMAEKDAKRYKEEMQLYNAGKFVPKNKNDSEEHDTETGDEKI